MLVKNQTAREIITGHINILKSIGLITAQEKKSILEVLSGCSNSEWLRKASSAQYLGVSIGTLEGYVTQGKLKASRLNKSLRFKREDLDALLEPVEGGIIK